MKNVLTIVKRNCMIFFRDKASVFFSMLSALIIIGLYVLFLRSLSFGSSPYDLTIYDAWVMAGVVGVTTLTATLGAMEIKISDRSQNTIKDFYVSPLSRGELTLGYVLSSVLIGFALSVVALIFSQVYILVYNGSFIGVISLLKMLGLIFISSLSGSSLMFFVVTFVKTTNAFAVISTIVGTLIGFVSGAFFPLNALPEAGQTVIKVLPVSHSVMLMRQVMARDTAAKFVPAQAMPQFEKEMGFVFSIGGQQLSPLVSILYLLAASALFFFLSYLRLREKPKD